MNDRERKAFELMGVSIHWAGSVVQKFPEELAREVVTWEGEAVARRFIDALNKAIEEKPIRFKDTGRLKKEG